jgi:hypothetical protein
MIDLSTIQQHRDTPMSILAGVADHSVGPVLCVVRGIPGTGKTTLAEQLSPNNICADDFFTQDRDVGWYYNKDYLAQAHRWCNAIAAQHIMFGRHVVVHNTFVQSFELEPMFQLSMLAHCPLLIFSLTKEYGSIHDVSQKDMNHKRNTFVPGRDITYPGFAVEFSLDVDPATHALLLNPPGV